MDHSKAPFVKPLNANGSPLYTSSSHVTDWKKNNALLTHCMCILCWAYKTYKTKTYKISVFHSVLCDFTTWMILRNVWETTVAAIPTPTAVNARITVQEMANGGMPRPTCDRLHQELPAGVNSLKEGSLCCPPNRSNDDHKSSIKWWMCQTTYDCYDRELSAGVSFPRGSLRSPPNDGNSGHKSF